MLKQERWIVWKQERRIAGSGFFTVQSLKSQIFEGSGRMLVMLSLCFAKE